MKCLLCEGWIISQKNMYCERHLTLYGTALPWDVYK